MNIYLRGDMYSAPRPPEAILLLSSWSQRAAAAFILAIIIVAAEGIFKRLRGSQPNPENFDDIESMISPNEYRKFIEGEMMRLRKEEEIKFYMKSQESDMDNSQYKQNPRYNTESTFVPAKEKQELLGDLGPKWRHPSKHSHRRDILLSMGPKHQSSCRAPATPRKSSRTAYATTSSIIKTEYSPKSIPEPSSCPGSISGSYYTTSSGFTMPSSPPSSTVDHSDTLQLPSLATLSPTNKNIIKTGDIVLRRRPTCSFLQGTVDETDLYDGPFIVLCTTLKNWVEILLPEGSKTPSWIKTCDTVLAPSEAEDVHTGVCIERDGGAFYVIGTLRGVRQQKCRRMTEDACREFLVHWKGWGCEDDTWEPEEGLPVRFVRDFEKRDREWRARGK